MIQWGYALFLLLILCLVERGKNLLISTTYLGPASYFAEIALADEIRVEAYETYPKQTYRNRCRIVTANGLLSLTIPVVKVNGNHTLLKDIEISYNTKWQQLHWRAITAAYRHSPYFMFYEDALKPFYHKHYQSLLEFNQELTKTIMSLTGIHKELQFTTEFEKEVSEGFYDLRNAFSPKIPKEGKFPAYIQVFEERHGFQQDLSILDVLLNLGPESAAYLESIILQ